jgi:hypothetical protein
MNGSFFYFSLCCFLLGGCSGLGTGDLPARTAEAKFGSAELGSIDPWPESSPEADDRVAWEKVIRAAATLQRTDPPAVAATLRKYQQEHTRNKEDGKLLILLRVAFAVPESLPRSERGDDEWFGGWMTFGADLNKDGTYNLAWPLEWNTGMPKLAGPLPGIQGRRYDAAGEYTYFLSRFKFRKLPKTNNQLF